MSDPANTNLEQPQYVEVALPLPLQQTFTYQLPESFRDSVQLGSRLLVPFGRRSLVGYAVEFQADLELESGLDKNDIKRVIQVLDVQPMLTNEILNLTRWAADYYAGSWGETLKASLPTGIDPQAALEVSITELGRTELLKLKNMKPVRARLLKALADRSELTQKEIEKEFGATSKRVVRDLLSGGFVSVAQRESTNRVKPRHRKAVRLVGSEPNDKKRLTDAQQKIIEVLQKHGGEMLFTDLLEAAESGASPIQTLARRNLVEVSVVETKRDPMQNVDLPELDPIVLNEDQSEVLCEITAALEGAEYRAFLLHGITGSGKTEVYIRAMRSALDLGRSALMLVPEIALTPIFSRRLRAVFGSRVAILHSNLSPGERFDEWRRIRSGEAKIAIGTRSAVFAPLQDLGLIIVDEEHDSSYRQNERPFYNARDVAVMRANLACAAIVLGSATPALESFHNAQSGKYTYLHLRNRIANRPLANAELIDMREVFKKSGKDVVLSSELIEAIASTHAKGEQSIILLNRRGFSSFVMCRSCGETLRCKNCDITLTYHRREGKLMCHYCTYSVKAPQACPFCKSEFLYFVGEGTEQLEEILNKRFPDLKVARIDRDSMARKGEMAKTLLAFDRGEIDMLVGTQMLAKGHDFHNVTLVGVISVDLGLGLPDFRSAERTFQLLTQVAGRAGRGELPGRVLIQTYYPEHYALKHAVRQDFYGFYAEEIRFRQRLSYPPFVVLASVLIKHKDEQTADRYAKIVKKSLENADLERRCKVLGVAPASIARLKGEYRFQILIKSESRKALRKALLQGLYDAELHGCDMRKVFSEIDPVNLM